MLIAATVKNAPHKNVVTVSTNDIVKDVVIPAKVDGSGSSVNGGELLFLSLATCFCNDVYREAAKRNMTIDSVDVTVSGRFGKEGEPASGIVYNVHVLSSSHSQEDVQDLIRHVDGVAEIHNTLRKGVAVTLSH